MGENGRIMKTLGELIDAYQAHLAEGSWHSLQAFAPLAAALEPLRSNDSAAMTPAAWRTWFTAHTAGLAPSTRNLRYRQLRALYGYPERWLGQTGLVNPFAHAGWRRVAPSPEPHYKPMLSETQVAAICHAPRTRRGRLLIRILAERGRRVGEVLAVTAGDFRDLVAGSGDRRVLIFPRTKGGREQFTVLPEGLAADLQTYIQEVGLEVADRLWPITSQAARQMVTHAAATIGLALSPHDLRRSFASHLDRSGVPVGMAQAMLGHSSSRTTAKYYIADRTAVEMGNVA